jgi:hypothetical protein
MNTKESPFLFDPLFADYESDEPPLRERHREDDDGDASETTVYYWRDGKLQEKDLSRNRRGEKHGAYRQRNPFSSSLDDVISGNDVPYDRDKEIAEINQNIRTMRRSESHAVRGAYWATHERTSSRITELTADFSDSHGHLYSVGRMHSENGVATTYKMYYHCNRGTQALAVRRGDRLVMMLTYKSLHKVGVDDPSVALNVGAVVYSNETARMGLDASGTLIVTPDPAAQRVFALLAPKE